jgi:hypothetical protein
MGAPATSYLKAAVQTSNGKSIVVVHVSSEGVDRRVAIHANGGGAPRPDHRRIKTPPIRGDVPRHRRLDRATVHHRHSPRRPSPRGQPQHNLRLPHADQTAASASSPRPRAHKDRNARRLLGRLRRPLARLVGINDPPGPQTPPRPPMGPKLTVELNAKKGQFYPCKTPLKTSIIGLDDHPRS